MEKIHLGSANTLFLQKNYTEAFHQYEHLVDKKCNPSLCACMAGKCLILLGNQSQGYEWYQRALRFDDSNTLVNREVEYFMLEHDGGSTKKGILLHYYPHTPNIGDSGSAAGIRYMVNLSNPGTFFLSLSCRSDTIAVVEKLSCRIRGIIIGGGGLFFHQPSVSGWYFPLSLSDIKNLDIPIVSYAIGFNQEFNTETIWELTEEFLAHIANFHSHFLIKSVRDTWSKTMLENHGVSDVALTPCPSAFLQPLDWFSPPFDTSTPLIILSITDRFLPQDQKMPFLTHILQLAKWIEHNHGEPLFIFQDRTDDSELATGVRKNKCACVFPNTAREAISLYAKSYALIGMRGHSLILAAGQCVPVFALSYNTKVNAFMDILELSDYCCDYNDQFQISEIIDKLDTFFLDRTAIVQKLKEKASLFRTMNVNYGKRIADSLNRIDKK